MNLIQVSLIQDSLEYTELAAQLLVAATGACHLMPDWSITDAKEKLYVQAKPRLGHKQR